MGVALRRTLSGFVSVKMMILQGITLYYFQVKLIRIRALFQTNRLIPLSPNSVWRLWSRTYLLILGLKGL